MTLKNADHMVIRPYQDTDLPYLLDIAVAAWTPIFRWYRATLGPDLFAARFPDWQADKRRQVENACHGSRNAQVWTAELDGQPVAFITYYLDAESAIGQIGNNAVHPLYQGLGIGTRMYEHVLARMKEQGMRWAKVSTGGDPSHAPARRAYEKAGFATAVPAVDYYREL